MNRIVPLPGEDLMELGKRCNAVYICPKVGGVRKGPLVAYAGMDKQGKNYVGDLYFNFRRIESHLLAVEVFAVAAYIEVSKLGLARAFDTVCGIPNGGRTLGQDLARIADKRFVYPEKTPVPTEAGKKQKYRWDLAQFDFEPGERIAVVEDVFNNFQNTTDTLNQIGETGAEVVVLVGALNRSASRITSFKPADGPFANKTIPVVASITSPFPEYSQDDPAVAADIAAGNLELQVKKNWALLRTKMGQ